VSVSLLYAAVVGGVSFELCDTLFVYQHSSSYRQSVLSIDVIDELVNYRLAGNLTVHITAENSCIRHSH